MCMKFCILHMNYYLHINTDRYIKTASFMICGPIPDTILRLHLLKRYNRRLSYKEINQMKYVV